MEAELISLCQQVLYSIAQQDWEKYAELCDESLSAFEPEGRGHLIEGLPFHNFYFNLEASGLAKQSTISSPNVRIMGDVAVVSYVRLVQALQGTYHINRGCKQKLQLILLFLTCHPCFTIS